VVGTEVARLSMSTRVQRSSTGGSKWRAVFKAVQLVVCVRSLCCVVAGRVPQSPRCLLCYHEFNSPSDACYAISCPAPWFSLVVVLPLCRWLLPLSRTGAATVGPHAWDPVFAAVSSCQTSAAGGGAPTSLKRRQG